METLRGVFPVVPTEALLRVLEICDQSVTVASTWLLENEWQDLLDAAEDEGEEEEDGTLNNVAPNAQQGRILVVSTEAQAADGARQEQQTLGPILARRPTDGYQYQEDLESEEDEEEDEDEMYDDSGDEGEFALERIPPLDKRITITATLREKGEVIKADDFWVAFDGQVVIKSMIELLNTTLSKLAHRNVVLLNIPARELDEAAARARLESILTTKECKVDDAAVSVEQLQSRRETSDRIALAILLNGGESGKLSSSTATITVPMESAGQKRKRDIAPEESSRLGYFAYFFPVKELDMVWRTVMHAHLFKGRFGEKIEFHTAASGSFSKREFDELMHVHSSALASRAATLGFSPLSELKCCLILPCAANEEEIFRVGKNVHATLKIEGSLYFQEMETCASKPRSDQLECPSDNDCPTEERFRQFARYRVKAKESVSAEVALPSRTSVDPYMSYQQPRKIKYCLEMLDSSKWTSCLDD
ncbi:hypothetical protein GN244_ATG04482 [Phytophthora infestans]|uniref:CUE domain-containing protein n=1 Tax=Phytophthora infestans TaxID=4787 RepID=A0A833W5G0_PHYIN|nr:hypothetical protein GN244_ATG04482 [Phytophthora infestans]KAF4129774.1 hypothetical protein GN958_ATG21035 [Phytophthora infestans]KAF4129858.1 hypothetical protein GN958_ATG20950 [Phytophthora infestans]